MLSEFWSREDNADLFRNVIGYLQGLSDLSLEKIKAQKKLIPGNKGKFIALIRNSEFNYSCASKISFYLSKDEKISKKDTLLGTLDVPQIKGSGKKKIKLIMNLPEKIKPGKYYLLVQLNPDEDPKEINSENNFKSLEVTVR